MWIGPETTRSLEAAVARGGGLVVAPGQANAFVWFAHDDSVDVAAALADVLHPGVRWVQLYAAGIESWLDAGVVDRGRTWTAATGAYAPAVAEHVVAVLLAVAKRLPQYARERTWRLLDGEPFRGSTVGLVGAGAIGRETIARLAGFGVHTIALTRSGRPVPGADRSVGPEGLDELLEESRHVVIAAPLTERTRGLIGARELERIGPEGVLVNVSRGGLVDTGALVAALRAGTLGFACVDVTDPEPLPDGHPLWSLPNALVTPHTANTWSQLEPALAELVAENVRRFRGGQPLLGTVDLDAGY